MCSSDTLSSTDSSDIPSRRVWRSPVTSAGCVTETHHFCKDLTVCVYVHVHVNVNVCACICVYVHVCQTCPSIRLYSIALNRVTPREYTYDW